MYLTSRAVGFIVHTLSLSFSPSLLSLLGKATLDFQKKKTRSEMSYREGDMLDGDTAKTAGGWQTSCSGVYVWACATAAVTWEDT